MTSSDAETDLKPIIIIIIIIIICPTLSRLGFYDFTAYDTLALWK